MSFRRLRTSTYSREWMSTICSAAASTRHRGRSVPGRPNSDIERLVLTGLPCATSWLIGRSFGRAWESVIFFKAAFRDGTCRRLRSRRMAAGNAVGGHRTLLPTILLRRSPRGHPQCALARDHARFCTERPSSLLLLSKTEDENHDTCKQDWFSYCRARRGWCP